MELRTLRAFVEVVRQGGFSQAAKAVFATQSTVSKAVRQLEDELGVPLLDRVAHRSRLTAAGEIVYRRAITMLAERDDLVAELGELRGLKRGSLRLGLPPLGSDTLFAPLFALYRSRYPGIEIHLSEHGSARLEEMVLAGDMDLAGSLLPISDDFEWQSVHEEPLMALLPAAHPLAGASSCDLKALAESPFLLFEDGFALNKVLREAWQRRGVTPTIAARSGQIDFLVGLVAAGLGVAFLPRMIAEQRAHPGVATVLLDEPGTAWHMALVWRRGGYLSHAARAWLALSREVHGERSDQTLASA
ncbi:LysR family transcriptional regulator [Azorhizobium doebereinerae]|uniref:LysR family transcriptional regulator n=1 Tax=Azorhizobium doebereinerae TaxID=281091 RepID=UPI0003FC3A30|nr:LysR family transcriptional regulator [Azorhizobium doebereinerae]